MLDNMLEAYSKMEKTDNAKKRILIAPSWGEDNILDSCIGQLVDQLYGPEHFIVIRPHPEYVKRFPGKIAQLKQQFADKDPENLVLETDFSSNVTIYTADLLISDWSSIAFEFSYTTKKPSLFINTKMKVLNPDYDKYPEPPLDILLRDKLGMSLDPDELDRTAETVQWMFDNKDVYANEITKLVEQYVYNIGHSGEAAGKYIISRLTKPAK